MAHAGAGGFAPQRGDAADHREIEAERLAATEPVLAFEDGETEDDQPVAGGGAGEDGGVGRGKRDDLEPGEGEVAGAGRPGAEAGEADGAGPAEAAAGEADRAGPRVDRPPQVAEEEAGEAEADPEQGPDRQGQRVFQRVAAAEEAGGDEGDEAREAEPARQGRRQQARAVDEEAGPRIGQAWKGEAGDGSERDDGPGRGDGAAGRQGEDDHALAGMGERRPRQGENGRDEAGGASAGVWHGRPVDRLRLVRLCGARVPCQCPGGRGRRARVRARRWAMVDTELQCVAPTGDLCGEGAVWAEAEACLYWVDINRFLVRRMDAAGAVRSWLFDEPATALALTDRPGTLLVALASRLILWRPADDGRTAFGTPLADWPRARFNDGRPDPQGRLMIGTMGNNVGPDGEGLPVPPGLGTLYRVDAAGGFTVEETGIGISNTICWSPDGGTFYFADTLANDLRAYPVDRATGALGTPRTFFAGYERGSPDGSAVDADGYIWNCRYGGGCVVRLSPEGAIDRIVELPCDNATTCTFGGPDLRTLYITTARGGGTRSERLSGSVFALPTPVPGLPERVFRLG